MTAIPDGSVIITPRQMYDELQATRNAVEKLTNTIDPALGNLRGDVAEVKTEVVAVKARQEVDGNRLTALETKLKVYAAVLAAAATIADIAISLLK